MRRCTYFLVVVRCNILRSRLVELSKHYLIKSILLVGIES
jgi:hypothetical protein